MPNDTNLRIGPVLSFRGALEIGATKRWRVSGMIGVNAKNSSPKILLSNQPCQAPVLLHEHNGVKFWRYDLSVSMEATEQRISYGFGAEGPNWTFTVPKAGAAPRMAYVSCNGYGNPPIMRKLVRPANATWADLLANHDRDLRPETYSLDKEQLWHEQKVHDKNLQRFHLLLMGGDQIYFDSIWEDVSELKEWVSLSRKKQLGFKVTVKLRKRIYDYYFNTYSARWLSSKRGNWLDRSMVDSADAMASMPTVMMWDDHDIFDGWGSYSPEMQHSEVFQTIFSTARQAFWVFQLQHVFETLPPLEHRFGANVSSDDPQFRPIQWTKVNSRDPLALPLMEDQPGFSFGFHLGAVALLIADLRTERSRHQIMSESTWATLSRWLKSVPSAQSENGRGCQHLLIMSSVPVAHPKLSVVEASLDAFGKDDVLDSNADDLKDHWSHDDHEGERKRLIEILGAIAHEKNCRVSIISGDVHVAAWGVIHRQDVAPTANWAQIQQFTSSAIVHPSLSGLFEKVFLSFLNSAASNPQYIDVDHRVEMMLFPGHNQYVMATRNWLALELDEGAQPAPKLWATWRCETPDRFTNHLYAVKPFNDGGT